MDVLGEVVADGGGRNRDARGPLPDEVFDVGEAVITGVGEVFDQSGRAGMAVRQCLRAGGPYGSDPGEASAGVPLVGEVEPFARAYGMLYCFARFESQQCGIADENGGIGLLKHSDRLGW